MWLGLPNIYRPYVLWTVPVPLTVVTAVPRLPICPGPLDVAALAGELPAMATRVPLRYVLSSRNGPWLLALHASVVPQLTLLLFEQLMCYRLSRGT